MPTLTPSNTTGLRKEDQTPVPSPGRRLDSAALVIIATSIALVGVGLALRSAAYQQALTLKIQAMVSVDDQIWIGLPDELIQINKDNKTLQRVPYAQMQLTSPITYAVKTRNNYWLQLFSGQIWRCDTTSQPCHQVTALGDGEDHYYSIAVLPQKNQIVAVNNYSAQITTLDADSGQIIATKIPYRVPKQRSNDLSALAPPLSMKSLDGWRDGQLYRPNRLHVYDNMLVQTDTGNYRVVAWPLDVDGMPLWQSPINLIRHTANQTYDVALISRNNPLDNRWLVLEGGVGAVQKELHTRNVLGLAKLISYPAQSDSAATRTPIDLDLPDPYLLTNLDAHSVLIADPSLGKIQHVDFSPYSDMPPSIMDYDIPGLQEPLQTLKHSNDRYKLYAKLAFLFFFAPLIGIFVLYRRGYDLNQKLGRS